MVDSDTGGYTDTARVILPYYFFHSVPHYVFTGSARYLLKSVSDFQVGLKVEVVTSKGGG